MELVLILVVFVGAPALGIAGIASAIAHWQGKRRGESTDALGRRIRRAFWIAFLIAAGIEMIAVGFCVASLREIG